MAENNEKRGGVIGEIILFSKTMSAIVFVLSGIWFIGQPFLDDYIEEKITLHDEQKRKEWSQKSKLRDQLSEKMGCDPDEVHIELGRLYKNEKSNIEKTEKELNNLWIQIDNDFIKNKTQRNAIIRELKYWIPESEIKTE